MIISFFDDLHHSSIQYLIGITYKVVKFITKFCKSEYLSIASPSSSIPLIAAIIHNVSKNQTYKNDLLFLIIFKSNLLLKIETRFKQPCTNLFS